ncbi:hypothetical protein WCE41_09685 [Luteimonas sp. MJ246]|uniref:hypothetical protein n=1 Tax=Luteimonas sp. MJ174 TaxID=3129237 RepID=UPI0031B9B5A0
MTARRRRLFHPAHALHSVHPVQRGRHVAAAKAAPDWTARVLLALMFLAAVAMLSLPPARGASDSFGWLPLWLAGLPGTAWLALAMARRTRG